MCIYMHVCARYMFRNNLQTWGKHGRDKGGVVNIGKCVGLRKWRGSHVKEKKANVRPDERGPSTRG